MASFGGELARLVGKILVVLGVVIVAVWSARRRDQRRWPVRITAAGVLAAFAIAVAIVNLHDTASVLSSSRRAAVSASAGLRACLGESVAGALVPIRTPFAVWVKQRLPPRAIYTLAPYGGPPDPWCLALVWLPALPAGPGGRPGWTITIGVVPPAVQARIRRHDPSVQVFAPGYVLAKDPVR